MTLTSSEANHHPDTLRRYMPLIFFFFFWFFRFLLPQSQHSLRTPACLSACLTTLRERACSVRFLNNLCICIGNGARVLVPRCQPTFAKTKPQLHCNTLSSLRSPLQEALKGMPSIKRDSSAADLGGGRGEGGYAFLWSFPCPFCLHFDQNA